MLKLALFVVLASVATQAEALSVQTGIQTENGNAGGAICSFPFMYDGQKYFECIMNKWYRPWCATTADYDQDKQWGECVENNCRRTELGNAGGACCKFPFNYQGKTYNKCIDINYPEFWCPVSDNYEKDGRWGECKMGSCVKTEGGNANGAACAFPFKYLGTTYNKCIQRGHNKMWCATTGSHDQDKMWGECVPDTDPNDPACAADSVAPEVFPQAKGKMAGTISSDGSKEKPYCSYTDTCEWDEETKEKCAAGLCKAAGYARGGSFVSAANDFCSTDQASDGKIWLYTHDRGVVSQLNGYKYAEITATCDGSKENEPGTISSDGSKDMPYCSYTESCEWDEETKVKCAAGLCKAAGYAQGGSFVIAANDFCSTDQVSDGNNWLYTHDRGVISQLNGYKYAEITATCDGSKENEPGTISSDGSKEKPHCSYTYSCEWGEETKKKCASGLCKAAGYAQGGSFVIAANDFCSTDQFSDGNTWLYTHDTGVVSQLNGYKYAEITATCDGSKGGK